MADPPVPPGATAPNAPADGAPVPPPAGAGSGVEVDSADLIGRFWQRISDHFWEQVALVEMQRIYREEMCAMLHMYRGSVEKQRDAHLLLVSDRMRDQPPPTPEEVAELERTTGELNARAASALAAARTWATSPEIRRPPLPHDLPLLPPSENTSLAAHRAAEELQETAASAGRRLHHRADGDPRRG